ncbi:hypothetical protein ASD43_16535 [Microbacterium sp. Root553]|nr:hypothetical protein ASD43_16535 [Microbacterium sp. Root553]
MPTALSAARTPPKRSDIDEMYGTSSLGLRVAVRDRATHPSDEVIAGQVHTRGVGDHHSRVRFSAGTGRSPSLIPIVRGRDASARRNSCCQ